VHNGNLQGLSRGVANIRYLRGVARIRGICGVANIRYLCLVRRRRVAIPAGASMGSPQTMPQLHKESETAVGKRRDPPCLTSRALFVPAAQRKPAAFCSNCAAT
jgi:hypothetical protein